MPLLCPIPRDDTYDLPEGRYRAVLNSARMLLKAANRPVQQVRLLFTVSIPSLVNKKPMAGRTFNFDLGRRSELRGSLESWLGGEWFANNTTVDFEQLIGRSADLNLIHRHNDGYDRPFVNIEAIHPAGSLKLTEQPAPIRMAVEKVNEQPEQWRIAA